MNELDYLTILEFARIGAACVPDEIVDELDISDDEFARIRELIQSTLEEN